MLAPHAAESVTLIRRHASVDQGSDGFGAGQIERHIDGGLVRVEPVTGAGHPPPQSPVLAVPVTDEYLQVEPRLLRADHILRPAALHSGLEAAAAPHA
jgi:hypothetical protein